MIRASISNVYDINELETFQMRLYSLILYSGRDGPRRTLRESTVAHPGGAPGTRRLQHSGATQGRPSHDLGSARQDARDRSQPVALTRGRSGLLLKTGIRLGLR